MDKEILNLCMKANLEEPISEEYKKTYGWNNGVVSFYTEEGEYYITPFCHDVKEYLESQGYRDANLTVIYQYSWPYVNGENSGPVLEGCKAGETIYLGGPADKEEAKKWYALCETAHEKYIVNKDIKK